MKKTSIDANTLGYLWCLYMTSYTAFKKVLAEHGLTLGEFRKLMKEEEEE